MQGQVFYQETAASVASKGISLIKFGNTPETEFISFNTVKGQIIKILVPNYNPH